MIPYTPKAITPNMYNIPTLTSATCRETTRSPICNSCPQGITAELIQAVIIAMVGPTIKRTLCAPAGIISSLKKNFPPSHNGCRIPNIPARSGPYRSCIKPAILRSASVEYIAITKVITKITDTNINFSITKDHSMIPAYFNFSVLANCSRFCC
ncbi:hypothetical protein D3C81_1408180 [compost metagenome]